ncbi:MAG: carboxymuconolactone decarboxylase family protein [Rouxiella aceris]|uniref:carboxymuconolactone decarboxylase family protein n=1 Tax=Rouxiella aceris TaxID=2703884 RepID=UPI00283ADF7C|nr:carboxymuconolactone decarboxylase family protein [Rouxiella aceris]MDR3434323.1 carboxymuconolactone decarboxylase family protein [Rouxiella aceris]
MDNLSPGNQTSAVKSGSPALAHYEEKILAANLWQRSELSARDRSVITLAVVISRNHLAEQLSQFTLALNNGVKPEEISEIIAHLAFYSGWGNAKGAAVVAAELFAIKGINGSALPAGNIIPLPLDQQAEEQRAQYVSSQFAAVSPGVVKFTTEAVFNDLWLRPDLAPRDRSLVTVSALVANGQVAQIPFHLNKAMDNGLTQQQAGEALTQLAFYAGWPNVFSALPVFKQVFASREL